MKKYIPSVKLFRIALILSGMLFMFILGIRLDFFQKKPHSISLNSCGISEKEIWMNILQQDQKIGYSHRRFSPTDNGYNISESTSMRINTMGMVQDVHIRTQGELYPDLTLSSFTFDLRSGRFHFKARGKVKGKTLTAFVGQQKMDIPIDKSIYLTSVVLDVAWKSGLKPGQSLTFFVFDPATMGQRPIRITMKGREPVEIMGKEEIATKMLIDFMGISQAAWIGKDGNVVREDGMMDITLKRVSKNEALTGSSAILPGRDLTQMVSVASNVPIKQRNELTRLCLKITGIKDKININGGRQTFKDEILTILKEDLDVLCETRAIDKVKFTASTPFVQSDHETIKNKVSEIVSPGDTPLTKARKLLTWIHENIEKRPVLSLPNALETLENRIGDCNEHAVLLAALARAAGIPAQIEAGLVYMKGRFYYHAWNVLYLGKWVTADALMNQMPADVTHIRLVRGEADQQIDLIRVIGRVDIKILEQS